MHAVRGENRIFDHTIRSIVTVGFDLAPRNGSGFRAVSKFTALSYDAVAPKARRSNGKCVACSQSSPAVGRLKLKNQRRATRRFRAWREFLLQRVALRQMQFPFHVNFRR
jgi:hypothetical protein